MPEPKCAPDLGKYPEKPYWPIRWVAAGWYRLVWDSNNFITKREDYVWLHCGLATSPRPGGDNVAWLEEDRPEGM